MASSLVYQTNASGIALDKATSPQHRKNEKPGSVDLFLRVLCCFPGGDSSSRSNQNELKGPLLPPAAAEDQNRHCLVLDLDETLVHSSFKPIANPDYVIPVEIEGTIHHVYVLKRPGVDQFLERCGQLYEVVIFTASLAKYADPLLDLLDIKRVVKHRLFRESCTCHEGNYVKDLKILGRPLERTIIIDNSPMSYLFQPENAIGVSSFIDDPNDRELNYCLPFLEEIVKVPNVVSQLHTYPTFLAEQVKRNQ